MKNGGKWKYIFYGVQQWKPSPPDGHRANVSSLDDKETNSLGDSQNSFPWETRVTQNSMHFLAGKYSKNKQLPTEPILEGTVSKKAKTILLYPYFILSVKHAPCQMSKRKCGIYTKTEDKRTNLVLLSRWLFICTYKTFVEGGCLQFLAQSIRVGTHENFPSLFFILTGLIDITITFGLICTFWLVYYQTKLICKINNEHLGCVG